MTREARIACTFCSLGLQEVPRPVAVEGGPVICSPWVMRCLHVLATGDEGAATEEPSILARPSIGIARAEAGEGKERRAAR